MHKTACLFFTSAGMFFSTLETFFTSSFFFPMLKWQYESGIPVSTLL